MVIDGHRLFAGFMRDVSAQQRSEDAIRDGERRYRALAENALDIVCELDAEGRFTYVSPNFERILGYDPDRLIGTLAFELVHPDDWQRVAEEFRAAVSDSAAGTTSYRAKRADGSWCWIETSANVHRDDAGGQHVVIVSRDISGRKQIEESCRESDVRLRTFVRNAPVIMFATDTDGVFTLYEGKGLERVGQQTGQFAGRSIFELYADNEQICRNLRRALGGEEFTDFVRIGAVTFDVHHTPILDADGAVTGMIGVLIDITDRLRAGALLASQKRVLEMIASGASLEDVLEGVVAAAEDAAPGAICSVMLLAPDGGRLRRGAGRNMPAALIEALDDVTIAPQGPSCSAAAYGAKALVTGDISADDGWGDLRDVAAASGLRACWSTPIASNTGVVLGTFDMYFAAAREPGADDRELMEIATRLAGIAVGRRRAEKAVRSRTAELERMYKRLVRTHGDLEESKTRLEEKSILLERALDLERERSRRDPLTGTLNHAAITDALREAIYDDGTEQLAIAMVDVDGLKAANDTYGHQVGDQVLVLVAEKLQRDEAIVGRYGGDEFVAVLPGTDRPAAERYRDAVLHSLAGAGLTDMQTGAYVPVVASMGLAIYPQEAEAVDDLIRLSDSAMYASRRARPAGDAGRALTRPLGGDRAAKMVGEIVPLLTSPGDLSDKLRLVAHRLSVGAGYDAVNFVVEGASETNLASGAFARVPERFLAAWDRREGRDANVQIGETIARTRRPLIIDDLRADRRLDIAERELTEAAGLRSALIAPMIWENDLIGVLSVASRRQGAFSVRDAEFVQAVATQVTAIVRMSSFVEQLQASSSQLRAAHTGTVLMLASAAEAHDHTTGRHLQRVREITEALARELAYGEDDARALGLAATLHDIGKIRVPDSVLGSSKALAEAEWTLMKQHTIWGSGFLSGQTGFELAASVARHHHERWDGAGYPDGIAGDAIPVAAQITTVADSLDAMTNDRPYRAGRPVGEAVAEIVRCSGTQFSPRVVDALVRLYERGELTFVRDEDHEGWEQRVAA